MMRKPGFMLLEVVIAMTLGSMLLGVSLLLMRQVTRNTTKMHAKLDHETHMLLLYRQLAQDIAGMTHMTYPEKKDTKGERDQDPGKEKIAERAAYALYAPDKEDDFLCTFFTTATTQFYGLFKPYFTRVVYKVEKTENNLLRLLRKEYGCLPFQDVRARLKKDTDFVELARDITVLDFTYYAAVQKEQKSQQEEVKYEMISQSDWGLADEEASDRNAAETKQKLPLFPQLISVEIAFEKHQKTTLQFLVPEVGSLPTQSAQPQPLPEQDQDQEEKSSDVKEAVVNEQEYTQKSTPEDTPEKDADADTSALDDAAKVDSAPEGGEPDAA